MLRRLLPVLAIAVCLLAPAAVQADTREHLRTLGGTRCTATSSFICVKLGVPLNHFDPSDPRTIKVAFAVHPAERVSHGLFVVATGGPGSSGILSADSYLAGYSQAMLNRYDIVFFDQRGIGRSGGLTCPKANAAARQSAGEIQPATIAFVNACVTELKDASLLPYVGTSQAVEDLEALRTALDNPPVRIFGESYGTQYAQTYAAAHPDAIKAHKA